MTTVEERLSHNKYELDEESHISVDQEVCAACERRYCLTICPAKVYTVEEGVRGVVVNHAGCLECGSCVAACIPGGLTWNMPSGAMGVSYRYA